MDLWLSRIDIVGGLLARPTVAADQSRAATVDLARGHERHATAHRAFRYARDRSGPDGARLFAGFHGDDVCRIYQIDAASAAVE